MRPFPIWQRPAHAYGLTARLAEIGLPPAGYRTLHALEQEGLLRSSWAPGRSAGPRRRVYHVTKHGVSELRADAPALANMAKALEEIVGDEEIGPPAEAPRALP